MSGRAKRETFVAILLAMALTAGCNNAGDSAKNPSYVTALDEILSRMRSERHGASTDEYVEELEKLRAQLLAQSAENARREELNRLLEQRVQKLEEELDFLKKRSKVEVQSIEIAFYSGGKDTDKDGKDDYMEVTVCPKDGDGHIMKATGKCRFELYRKSFIGVGKTGRRLMNWDFSYEEVNKSWVDRLFSGYTFELHWAEGPPAVKEVVLEAVFETPDGREFTARKTMKLRL